MMPPMHTMRNIADAHSCRRVATVSGFSLRLSSLSNSRTASAETLAVERGEWRKNSVGYRPSCGAAVGQKSGQYQPLDCDRIG